MPILDAIEGISTRIIQAKDVPLFCGDIKCPHKLYCEGGCGSLLIDNYYQDSYVDLHLQCFRCQFVTKTPPLPAGEILSNTTLSLEGVPELRFNDTVNVKSGLIICSGGDILKEMIQTRPIVSGHSFELSEVSIDSILKIYDDLSRGQLSNQLRFVRLGGEGSVKKFPLPWACMHARELLENRLINLEVVKDKMSLLILYQFSFIVHAWSHHPRFQINAKGLAVPDSFFHTCAQFLTAYHLFNAGNRIGFSDEGNSSSPNPDLYTRISGVGRHYLEVKAPKALQWPLSGDSNGLDVEKAISLSIKKSSKQINRSYNGALVLYSSFLSRGVHDFILAQCKNSLNKLGSDHKSMSAIILLSNDDFSIRHVQGQRWTPSVTSNFSAILNPHYRGENPIKIPTRF